MLEARIVAICEEAQRSEWLLSQHFIDHQLTEENRPTVDEARDAFCTDDPEVIEDHPVSHYGPECLIASVVGGRDIHVQCSYPPGVVVITAYWPDTEPDEWTNDYRRRA